MNANLFQKKSFSKLSINTLSLGILAVSSISFSTISIAEPLPSQSSPDNPKVSNPINEGDGFGSVEATSILVMPGDEAKHIPPPRILTDEEKEAVVRSGRGRWSPKGFIGGRWSPMQPGGFLDGEQKELRSRLFSIIDSEYDRCINQATRFFEKTIYRDWISQCVVIRDNGRQFWNTLKVSDYKNSDLNKKWIQRGLEELNHTK